MQFKFKRTYLPWCFSLISTIFIPSQATYGMDNGAKKGDYAFNSSEFDKVEVKIDCGNIVVEEKEGLASARLEVSDLGAYKNIVAKNEDRTLKIFGNKLEGSKNQKASSSAVFKISLPSNKYLNISLAAGEVSITSVLGDKNIKLAKGEVTLKGSFGNTTIEVASGSITGILDISKKKIKNAQLNISVAKGTIDLKVPKNSKARVFYSGTPMATQFKNSLRGIAEKESEDFIIKIDQAFGETSLSEF